MPNGYGTTTDIALTTLMGVGAVIVLGVATCAGISFFSRKSKSTSNAALESANSQLATSDKSALIKSSSSTPGYGSGSIN